MAGGTLSAKEYAEAQDLLPQLEVRRSLAAEGAEKALSQLLAQHEKEKEQLYAEIGRLTTQLKWLEKKARSVGITLEAAKLD